MRFLESIATALNRSSRPLPDAEYAEMMGWRWDRDQTTLEGRFRTPYSAPRGRLTRHPDGSFTLYIINPPDALVHKDFHSCKCFTPTSEKGEYSVHFEPPKSAVTIDGAIQTVERNLVQACQLRR
jgi:hypothetical protein